MVRRDFLKVLPAAVSAGAALAAQTPASFRFVHFTDPHIQPELRAVEGCERCFSAVNAAKVDFAVSGGDLVFDVLESGPQRAKQLFDLYTKTAKGLSMPVYNVVGNHDVYGVFANSGVSPSDPMYGKKMFEDRIGKRYQSFDHKGWHFILLDSIGITPDRRYIGEIDEEQLSWLKSDLESVGPRRPVVVFTHIPLVTGFPQFVLAPGASTRNIVVTNSRDVLAVLAKYNVKAVLQGHTHVRETVLYKGCQFITSGSVCGNWWKGERMGHPEGFAVLTVRGETIEWSYQTYGWKAAAA
ncbi:MAG: metallophosphoesterase [Bryobacteraceae bacterium]|jgi:Predicted phosphohydrolases|nr:metallophosphoesterase [Bryobacteraceae bacterium]